jgi:hypothetical protein
MALQHSACRLLALQRSEQTSRSARIERAQNTHKLATTLWRSCPRPLEARHLFATSVTIAEQIHKDALDMIP